MIDSYEVLFLKKFPLFSFLIEELLKNYCCLTHERCNNWTAKFDVTKYLSLNTKQSNIQNYDIFLKTSVDDFI